MSTCPIGFLCNNWKYVALGAVAIVGAKVILSGALCGGCCGGKKKNNGSTTTPTKDITPLKEPRRPLDAVVFSGPSGVGKGTLIKKIRDLYPNKFAFSVSHTTRASRDGEVDGVHYHFIDRAAMEKMIENNEFLEACNVHGNIYGTSKKALQTVSDCGKVAIVEMDVQGAQKLKLKQGDLNFYYIFIAADNAELEKRLIARGSDDAERIRTRLMTAKSENKFVEENPNFYDKVIVNDDVDATAAEIIRLLKAQGAEF